MKFLVDAQLPRRLARWLQVEGHEAFHTQDLPQGNRTGDTAINELSMRAQRAVITKDEDFVDMFCCVISPTNYSWFPPAILAMKNWSNCSRTTSKPF